MYPAEVIVAPEWEVRVLDGEGKPLAGVFVRRVYQHYSVEEQSHEEDAHTDVEGCARFERRTIRASKMRRIIGAFEQISQFTVHASWGPHAFVFANHRGYGEMSGADMGDVLWSGEGEGKKSTIVLRRCPDGYTGAGCVLPDKPPPLVHRLK